jgi:DNA repair photolyase
VEQIKEIIAWPAAPDITWRSGFLAGIFDAEGGFHDGALRITNTDPLIIRQTIRCLKGFAFPFVIESANKNRKRPMQALRLLGGLRQHLRFFHTADPAIARKRNIEGQALESSADLRVASIEPLGVSLPLFDITTGTGDFIANGVLSHNCYARPTHEYLGFSAGLDFESKIMVKEDAPELLRRELSSARWQPKTVSISGVTDPYQPVERRLQLTRRCLEVLAEFRNPVGIVTKNHLVTRDLDILAEVARYDAAAVFLSVTTLDGHLARNMEPRASQPQGRLAAIEAAAKQGVPVGVLVAPVIPGLTDHEMPAILAAAAAVGAKYAGYILLRLPLGVGPLFEQWLTQHYPEKKDKVLGRIRDMRGGKLNDPRFGSRMRGEGPFADLIKDVFTLACRKAGITGRGPTLSTAAFRRPSGSQRLLFEE